MRRLSFLLLVLSATLGFGAAASAQSKHYVVHNDGGSRVQFVSDAPLETITGIGSYVTGDVNVDTSDLSSARGTIHVRTSSLETGVDLRDEHLHGDGWLDSGRFPEAVFEITRVEGPHQLRPNHETRMRLHGHFTLHGVTHDIVADARIRLIPLNDELRAAHIDGDVISAQASFSVELTDYGISVPLPVRLKVSNEIRVNVRIRAVAEHG